MGKLSTRERERFDELALTGQFTKKELSRLFDVTMSTVDKMTAGYTIKAEDPRNAQNAVRSEDYYKVRGVYLDLTERDVRITFANLSLYSKVRRNDAIRCVERMSDGLLKLKKFEDVN